MSGPIPATRLRPALWGTAMISALLVAGMALVEEAEQRGPVERYRDAGELVREVPNDNHEGGERADMVQSDEMLTGRRAHRHRVRETHQLQMHSTNCASDLVCFLPTLFQSTPPSPRLRWILLSKKR